MEIEDNKNSMKDNSKYEGIKLMPQIFAELMINNLDGKRFKRKDAIEIVKKDFIRQGGSVEQVDYVSVFKKATSYLISDGLSNLTYGMWELHYQKNITEVVKTIKRSDKMKIFEAEIGSGDESVYVYYFDVYRQLAIKCNKIYWPCKIGMTTDNAYKRILDQERTVFPEIPKLAILIHTNDAHQLEKTIHSILNLWDKKIDSPGNEWYLTNDTEILNIMKFLLPKLDEELDKNEA